MVLNIVRVQDFQPFNFIKVFGIAGDNGELVYKGSGRNNSIREFGIVYFAKFNSFVSYLFRKFENISQSNKILNILSGCIMP